MNSSRRVVCALAVVMACAGSVWGQGAQGEMRAAEQKVVKAWPLPLSAVRITGGPLKMAMDADGRFLMSVEPDRALSAFRTTAGLQAKAEPLTGWDAAVGRQLTGHIAGHLLSALSLMYAATGEEKFKQRADYMVKELAEIQEKNGGGYIGAQQDARRTPEREIFSQVAAGNLQANYESLNGLWSPWYVQHKMFAGLRDAYRQAGNKEALEVETKLAGWAEGVLKNLSEAQIQKMLEGEFGGMGEVLVDLYADTGDRRWLELSYKFEHKTFIEPLVQRVDKLGNVHGNHNIPTLMGNAERYLYAGKAEDWAAAKNFWGFVVEHHTFATGGNSGAVDGEFFPYTDKLAAMITAAPAAQTNESCNVYNMMKLTRRLFSFEPDGRYADFLERALFNHALAQINPANGVMSYHVPVGQGVRRDYQGNAAGRINNAFTCCVGTGMENPALYGEGMFYAMGEKLWVNVYAPATAEWAEAGARVVVESDMPEGEMAKMTVTMKAPKAFSLMVRRPGWTTEGFKVRVNGEEVAVRRAGTVGAGGAGGKLAASEYVEIARTWKTGDVVELTVPKALRLEATPDDANLAAIMWGPLVLAEDMGAAAPARGGRGAAANNPVIVTATRTVSEWLKPEGQEPGKFYAAEAGRLAAAPSTPMELHFLPLYQLHDHTYSVYMNLYTPEAWLRQTGTTR